MFGPSHGQWQQGAEWAKVLDPNQSDGSFDGACLTPCRTPGTPPLEISETHPCAARGWEPVPTCSWDGEGIGVSLPFASLKSFPARAREAGAQLGGGGWE